MTPDDDLREVDFFEAQSMEERLMRFMGARGPLQPHEVRKLTHLDFDRDFAIVAVDRKTDALAGIARYARDRTDFSMAEAGVAVLQKYQRFGLAWYLLATLFEAARMYGVQTIIADILRENIASRKLFDTVASRAGASKRLMGVDAGVFTYHFGLSGSQADTPHLTSNSQQPTGRPLPYVLEHSRHPRSLWRHDLVFPSGLRVEVRPADPDDQIRVRHFTEAAVALGDGTAVINLAHIDFTSGFTLVAIDTSTDEFVGVAHFQRGIDWLKLDVLTDPDYRRLGIADFLAAEVVRAAESEVLAPARSAI